jgi:hypothetical protein
MTQAERIQTVAALTKPLALKLVWQWSKAGTINFREFCELIASLPTGLDYSIDDYHKAPSGMGPLAATWADKPHRLVYDLCRVLR